MSLRYITNPKYKPVEYRGPTFLKPKIEPKPKPEDLLPWKMFAEYGSQLCKKCQKTVEVTFILAKNRELNKVSQGDLLAVMSAGAYGFTMSSNYNSRPRVAEVLVKAREFFVIRERETYRDLIRGSRIPEFLK